MRIRGHLYESGSSERIDATLACEQGRFHLLRAGDTAATEVEVRGSSERLAGIPQTLTLGSGQRFVPFEELPPGLLGDAETKMSRWTDWLERFSPVKAAILVGVLALAVLGLRAAVPVAADRAVVLIPHRAEAFVGRQAFRELDAAMFSPTRLADPRRARIEAAAQALARRGGIDPIPELHFRAAPLLGANAFAFPGGPIVVTDDLVHLLDDDDLILAVVAHELGHVRERHGLRQVLRVGGMFVIASAVLGADDSLLEELAAISVSTVSAGYSRNFERDADAFAGRLLDSAGRSAGDLADAFRSLLDDCGEMCRGDTGWLSSHPGLESRIEALEEQE